MHDAVGIQLGLKLQKSRSIGGIGSIAFMGIQKMKIIGFEYSAISGWIRIVDAPKGAKAISGLVQFEN